MNVRLRIMTKELARQYYSRFEMDPMLFMDLSQYQPYVYCQEKSDARVERYQSLGRVFLAVMLEDDPIGEVVFKNIDSNLKHCTLGISLVSDAYKNKGIGTRAEILALDYAFREMGMQTVFADSILRNTRSQHVLKKVGFQETSRDDTFVYYRCDEETWKRPDIM